MVQQYRYYCGAPRQKYRNHSYSVTVGTYYVQSVDGTIKISRVERNDILICESVFFKLVYLIFVLISRKQNEKVNICASGRRIAARSKVWNIIQHKSRRKQLSSSTAATVLIKMFTKHILCICYDYNAFYFDHGLRLNRILCTLIIYITYIRISEYI